MNRLHKQGFTIIELMLAMSFLSLLMLAIAMTTIQIGHIYAKGITLREVNQAGRTVIDDLRRTVGSSGPFDTRLASTYKPDVNGSGRLCLGSYSYVWNAGKVIASNDSGLYKYSDGTVIHLAKVNDPDRRMCTGSVNPSRTQSVELLTSGDRDLVLHEIKITPGARDVSFGEGQQLYAVSFTIGTNTGDETAAISTVSSCKAPNDATTQGKQDYCSVNKFDIVVRAGGTGATGGDE